MASGLVLSLLLLREGKTPVNVRERSLPQLGQQGMALRRGGGRMGVVRVMVDDILVDCSVWRCIVYRLGRKGKEGAVQGYMSISALLLSSSIALLNVVGVTLGDWNVAGYSEYRSRRCSSFRIRRRLFSHHITEW